MALTCNLYRQIFYIFWQIPAYDCRSANGVFPDELVEQAHHIVQHLGDKGCVWQSSTGSNRIPPSLNPTKHFVALKDQREVFGRLVQCRTGHAYTREFHKQFFPEKSTNCKCGEDLQTRKHIIQECTQYMNHWEDLREINCELALPELLGTPKGIATLADFLKDSGMFTFTGEKYMPKERLPTFLDEPEPPDIDSEDENSDNEC